MFWSPTLLALILPLAAAAEPAAPPAPGTVDPKVWTAYLSGAATWKEEVDLRPEFNRLGLYTEVQGARPSCAVFALTGALEYQIGLLPATGAGNLPKARRLSEDFLLWGTLQESRSFRSRHTEIADSPGFSFQEVCLAISHRGLAWQDEQPNTFAPGLGNLAEPSVELQKKAPGRWEVKSYFLNSSDPEKFLTQTVLLLNAGVPVAIGLDWPDEATLVHAPVLNAQPAGGGAHGVLLVGYWDKSKDRERRLVFRNSYGPRWGRAGYGFMSPEYFRKHVRTGLFLTVQPAG